MKYNPGRILTFLAAEKATPENEYLSAITIDPLLSIFLMVGLRFRKKKITALLVSLSIN
jgi:hypothetical protein